MKRLVLCLILLIVLATTASAATKIWVGTDSGNEGAWSTAANWSPSGVPANGDDVYFENSSQSVTAGFDQSTIALDSLNFEQSYTGSLGDDVNNLDVNSTTVSSGYHYGPGTPAGSPLINLKLGSTQSTVTVYNTGTSSNSNKPAFRLKCNNASTTVEVRKGSVGIAVETGDTATLGTLNVSYVSQVNNDADVFVNSGTTLTILNQTGGDTILRCGATTVNAEAGTLKIYGSGAVTTLNIKGGTATPSSTGAITTCNITGGTADFAKSAASRTVTTLKLEAGGTLKYDPDVLTITNKVDCDNPVKLTATAP